MKIPDSLAFSPGRTEPLRGSEVAPSIILSDRSKILLLPHDSRAGEKGPSIRLRNAIGREMVSRYNKFEGAAANGEELVALDEQERATIAAALRFYRDEGMGDPSNRSDLIHDIATAGDRTISLDADAIEKLESRIAGA